MSAPAYWQYYEHGWVNYATAESASLEASFQKGSLLGLLKFYRVDFPQTRQENRKTGTSRRIKRIGTLRGTFEWKYLDAMGIWCPFPEFASSFIEVVHTNPGFSQVSESESANSSILTINRWTLQILVVWICPRSS